MRAAFLVKTGNSENAFTIQETTAPEPLAFEVQLKVETFGLNYADVMARRGIYDAAPVLPSILGYEAVGIITKLGTEVTDFKVGDRILAFTRFGAYSEICTAHHQAICLLPEAIPNEIATALATQYCTALYAADWMANIRKNEKILVHAGAGGVGHGLIQYAKTKGCIIVATAGSEEKIKYLQTLGVDHAINYTKFNFRDQIQDLLGDRPIDAIFDPIGGKNYGLNRDLLSVGGRMIIFGISSFSKKKGTFIDKLQLALQFGFLSPLEFLIKSNGVIGVNMLHVADEKPHIIQELLQESIKGYQSGQFLPKTAFHGSIDALGEAHQLLENRGTIGKLSISW
ncbi:MAG: NADPH:quinone reductase-like Zn-dependent oxidoreductase [Salibacteraceae bacterium]|jgi:NADPH2:quinone reductase